MRVDLTRTRLGWMRSLRIALLIGFLAAACASTGSRVALPSATPSASGLALPSASPPRPSPTPPPSAAAPLSAGAVADAGVLYVWGADDGIYRYDGATGALVRVWRSSALAAETAYGPYVLGRHGGITLLRWDGATEPTCPRGSFAAISIRGACAFTGEGGDAAVYVDRGAGAQMLLPADWGATSFAWSPDGAELAIIRREGRADPVPPLEPLWRSTLWHMDRHGALMKIFDSPSGMSSLYGLKWSFDRRVLVWESTTTSNSLAADGVGTSLHVVNVDTRAEIDLGMMLGARAWAQWSVDGRLAFV